MNMNALITEKHTTTYVPYSTFASCFGMVWDWIISITFSLLFVWVFCLLVLLSFEEKKSFKPSIISFHFGRVFFFFVIYFNVSSTSKWHFLLEMNFTVIVIKEKATHTPKKGDVCCVALKTERNIFRWLGILIRPQDCSPSWSYGATRNDILRIFNQMMNCVLHWKYESNKVLWMFVCACAFHQNRTNNKAIAKQLNSTHTALFLRSSP